MTASATLEPTVRDGFLRLVEERFGLRSSRHQARHLEEAVQALQGPAGCTSPEHLLALFVTGMRPDLLEQLVARLTVGETHFFRVGAQMDALRKVVLPDILGRRISQRRLSIWSAGCSTGEEPYTVAILLREALPSVDQWGLTFLGTDISGDALHTAREASYGDWSFRDTPETMRQRYFTREGLRWHLSDAVKRMVVFDHWNLADEMYPSPGLGNQGFDLILCRNVTIYFSAELTQQVYRRFAQSLAPGGWLVLGPSDAIPELPTDLEVRMAPGTMLWRRPLPGSHLSAQLVGPLGQPTLPPAAGTRVAPAPDAPPPPAVAPAPTASAPRNGHSQDIEHLRSLVYSGDGTAAMLQAVRITNERPLEPEAHLVLGMLHLDEGKVEQAVESLRRATFLDSHHPLAHFTLGRAYLLSGDHVRAGAALTHARRTLAVLADDQPIEAGGGLVAGELRVAIDTHLALVGRMGTR
jgi:chemotaxis protein methyltransferase CheR